jgi:queuosine precursor transporter
MTSASPGNPPRDLPEAVHGPQAAHGPLGSRSARLFVVLAAFLVGNAMIAEFVGVKIFALEPTLRLSTFDWNLFGQSGSLSFTSGVLLWPFVFLMTDVINEYFGRRGVQFISWLTVGLIVYGFLAAYMAISLAPADFWISVNREHGVPDMQAAFASIFGQGMWTIAGSITAFLIGQLIDVAVFHRIRLLTGERWIWLRATGSTAISQLIDSFVVLYIAFVLGPQHWPVPLFLAVGTVNYGYKLLMAFLLIPLIYLARRAIHAYLGHDTAEQLQRAARTSN